MASFQVTMQLQRETENGWKDMGGPEIDKRIPKVGRRHETIVIYLGCFTGTWRSKVSVAMQEDADSDHFELGQAFSAPNHIDCET